MTGSCCNFFCGEFFGELIIAVIRGSVTFLEVGWHIYFLQHHTKPRCNLKNLDIFLKFTDKTCSQSDWFSLSSGQISKTTTMKMLMFLHIGIFNAPHTPATLTPQEWPVFESSIAIWNHCVTFQVAQWETNGIRWTHHEVRKTTGKAQKGPHKTRQDPPNPPQVHFVLEGFGDWSLQTFDWWVPFPVKENCRDKLGSWWGGRLHLHTWFA